MIKKEDVAFLGQLIDSMEESEIKLRKAYEINDINEANKAKKLILQLQKKVLEVLR